LAGILIVIVGVIVKPPRPVPEAALKNFTAVGAEVPAGTLTGYVTLLVGFVQLVLHVTLGVPLMLEAVFDNECVPVVSVVDVIVKFHPAPLPRVSTTVNPSE
jgi:hypothetical protein